MNTHCYDLPIRVLVSKEDGEFVALGLEVDLLGYGGTEKAALAAFSEMLHNQISFAVQTNRPELVWHPAPKVFFNRWEKASQAALVGAVSEDLPVKMQAKATFVMLTQQEIQSAKTKSFKRELTLPLAKAT